MRMRLPILVDQENRVIAGVLLYAATAALYLASNRFHIFSPQLLLPSRIDVAVPFVPHTVWLYVSEYFYFAVIYLSFRDMVNLNRFIYAFFSFLLCCVLIFWLWPTTIARDLFPLPETLDPATSLVLTALRQVDTPANCSPSFHVGSVFLSSFLFFHERRWTFWFFLVWATAISLSTLTVKQHYFVDVVSGFGLCVIFYCVFRKARFTGADILATSVDTTGASRKSVRERLADTGGVHG